MQKTTPNRQAHQVLKSVLNAQVTHGTRAAQGIRQAQPVNIPTVSIQIEYFSDDFTDQAITTISIVLELPVVTNSAAKLEDPPKKDGD
jgi:hypothetical protein